ncbi:DUF4974 domain-containing protein [Pedobacter sp. BS3]|uniref:FecR family protein n=1 Tax=Pedobacter sp. BS3 TaxID=2567937 RepID=UPI0011EDAF53|nr:FecR family protein [Pedobacter sp. BS3]TZF81490.1 DUF4974 domain-containing protein [Pedobacter sp. BS3]
MQPVDRALIEKYIKGQCTPEEEEQIHLWIDANDADEYPFFLSEKRYRRREQKNWKRLISVLEGLKPLPKYRSWEAKHLLRYAAVLAFIAGVWLFNHYTGGVLWWTGEKFKTGYGETRQVNLPDGSVVMLNVMSELKIPEDYGKSRRELYLTGEGYFKVQKDKSRPFIVYSNHISTTALGTVFNVSAYPGEETFVSLERGMVKIQDEKKSQGSNVIILKPGEEVTWHENKKLHKNHFSAKERLSWTEHVLYFKDAGIEKVISDLERYYGVTFDYSALTDRDWKLNGEYKNLSLKEILESLSFNYNIHYRIEKDKVILSQ